MRVSKAGAASAATDGDQKPTIPHMGWLMDQGNEENEGNEGNETNKCIGPADVQASKSVPYFPFRCFARSMTSASAASVRRTIRSTE